MISLIIPIYNQANKLPKCLDSIFGQTYKNFEIIIVNDGSTDDVQEIIKEYGNKLKVIKFIKLKVNGGAPAARNRGFRESRGEYLFFCDADAVLVPGALETMLGTLESHLEASFAYSSFLWGKKLFKVGPFSE